MADGRLLRIFGNSLQLVIKICQINLRIIRLNLLHFPCVPFGLIVHDPLDRRSFNWSILFSGSAQYTRKIHINAITHDLSGKISSVRYVLFSACNERMKNQSIFSCSPRCDLWEI